MDSECGLSTESEVKWEAGWATRRDAATRAIERDADMAEVELQMVEGRGLKAEEDVRALLRSRSQEVSS